MIMSAADFDAPFTDAFFDHERAYYPWMYLRFLMVDNTENYAWISMEEAAPVTTASMP